MKTPQRKIAAESTDRIHLPPGIERFGTIERFPSSTPLIRQGSTVNYLYLLREGRCSIDTIAANGRRMILRTASAGELLGEIELLSDQPAAMSVRTLTSCAVMIFPMAQVRPVLLGDAKFLRNLCLFTIHKEHENAIRLICSESLPLKNRLASFLIEHAEGTTFRIRKSEIADSLGASYRHIETLMSDFCANGLLAKSGRTYELMDLPALQQLAQNQKEL